MKKYLALILGVLFVLSFAASAFAIHAEIPAETQSVIAKGATQITLGGEIRTRGWWRDNFAGGLGVATPNQAWWDERVRLSLDAVIAPGIEGFVQLESHSGYAGDKYAWGNGATATSFTGPQGSGAGFPSTGVGGTNAKPSAYLDILQAWIVYSGQGLLGFNSGVKVGHMPLKLAYGQFFDNTQYGDDALVLFMTPIKGLEVALLTFKGSEGLITNNHDDLDAYVGLTTFKWDDKNTVGANYTFINSNTILGLTTPLKLQNLGLHADGAFGGLGYKAAADIQFGDKGEGATKKKFKGYAVSAGVNYMLDPVNVRGNFVLGSGDKDPNDSDLKEFVDFEGNIQNYSFIYEYYHKTAALNGSGLNSATPSDGHAAGVANTTYYNLGVDFNATKDLALSADGYIFRATKVASGSKNAGWEIDAKMKYALAKNLSYQIDAGYFKPGKFYEDQSSTSIDTKGVTQLRHMLTLSF